MGITIHYRGKIDDIANVEPLADEMADFSQELGWDFRRWNEDWMKPNTAEVIHKEGMPHITGYLPLRGIDLLPHKDSESFSLTFTREGYLVGMMGMTLIAEGERKPQENWMSTKTQFAPIEIHITIVKLLKYLKKRYISNLEVYDDGGYWETGDIDELQRRINSINQSMDMLEEALSEVSSKNIKSKSPEEIADLIEEIIKNKFGKGKKG